MKIFNNIISQEDLVFDVGSNIGDKSEIFLNLGANVVGFEPQHECYFYANSRFQNNPKYKGENLAIDTKQGVSVMYIASYHSISSMSQKFIEESKKERFQGYNWDNQREIQTNTLDNMIEKYGTPVFIKIDIEGYELNALKGLTKPISIISVEFNPELCENTIECIEYIDSLNESNTIFNYGYRNDEYFKYDEWVSKEIIIEYLRSVNDFKFEFGDVYCKKI
jgi:FkbM family methyltransferase